MLTQVSFKNLRALADVTLDLGRFTVLVGPNGCGKSTVLNQIEWLCQASFPTQEHGHLLGWPGVLLKELGPYDHRTHGREDTMMWSGRASADVELTIEVGDAPNGRWWQATRLGLRAGPRNLTLQSPNDKIEQSMAFDEALREDFAWRAQRLRLSPVEVVYPSPVSMRELEPSGFGLPTILKDLAADDAAAYQAVQEDMQAIVPHFRKTRFDKGIQDKKDVNLLLLEMVGGRRPAREVSDGTLLALALLTAVHNRDMPPLILMDDIDHGLHLSAQYQIIKAVRRVMERRPELQVICTAHSPFLFEGIDGSEVRVMALDADGHTRVKPLTAHPEYARWRKVMNTGEVWANLGEDWVTRD